MRDSTVRQPNRYRPPRPSAYLSSFVWLPSSFFFASLHFSSEASQNRTSRAIKTECAKSCSRLGAAHGLIINCTEASRTSNHNFLKNDAPDIFRHLASASANSMIQESLQVHVRAHPDLTCVCTLVCASQVAGWRVGVLHEHGRWSRAEIPC